MKVFGYKGIYDKYTKTYNSQINELPKIPEKMASYIYEMYCKANGNEQSFEKMHNRNGFGTVETIYYLFAKILELEENTK